MESRGTEYRARPVSPAVTTGAGRQPKLFTRRFGPPPRPGGPVMVLVHGLGLSGRYFVPLARRLAADGASVLVPDLPGHVRSRAVVRRVPDTEGLAAALARWLDRAAPGPVHLVANSVGCQVAVALAARHPRAVRSLVLIGPALDPGTPSPWRQGGRLLADVPREPLGLLALAAADYLVTGPVRFAAAFRHARRYAAGPFERHLARVGAPTLVVRGADDPLAPRGWTEHAARLLRHGRTAVVPGAAHAAHYSAPGAVAALVTDFTNGATPPGGEDA
ncbi:alpha/beta fold hydrolase [Streptomyces sp. NPDC050856]|uniref:alpha/beta fold hydrolase n=1 Tax=Streptomyces sp. NPDC050856 TaxID=3154939 RepID=UPI00340984E2